MQDQIIVTNVAKTVTKLLLQTTAIKFGRMNRQDIQNAHHSNNNKFKSNIFHGHCNGNRREHAQQAQQSFKTNEFNICNYEIEN